MIARQILEAKGAAELAATIVFDSSGYELKTATGASRTAWSALYSYHEGPTTFLLYSNPVVHQIVPKRAFHDADVPRIRELLRAQVTQRHATSKRRFLLRTVALWILLLGAFAAIRFLTGPAH